MGEAAETKIPSLTLPAKVFVNPDEYKTFCNKVREACESYGCFVLGVDEFPRHLHEEMFAAVKVLFDLPEETKNRYRNPKPYRSYSSQCPVTPLLESFGIDDPHAGDVAQTFTDLMWPEGNAQFCETIKAMSLKMVEMNFMIMRMIFESFGTGKLFDTQVGNSTGLLRLSKYKVPPRKDSSAVGLLPHTDKNLLTVLCQNEVQGLEVLSKDGDQWIQVVAPKDSFILVVGDVLKAWSNGRLHAARHRVVISGNSSDRYSCGFFTMPKEDATIEVPQELVDNENPLLYKPFKYGDYISYFASNISDDALEIYAGV